MRGESTSWRVFTPGCKVGVDDAYQSYSNSDPVANDKISMTGTISPGKADVQFTIADTLDYGFTGEPLNAVLTFRFNGIWLKNTATLDTAGEKPTTEGRFTPPPPAGPSSDEVKMKKMIAAISGGIGGAILLFILCCCGWCCYRSRKRNSKLNYGHPL
jgi:hypothetical protein